MADERDESAAPPAASQPEGAPPKVTLPTAPEAAAPDTPAPGAASPRRRQRLGELLRRTWSTLDGWASNKLTLLAYRLLSAAFLSLLMATAFWLLLLTLATVSQDKSATWNNVSQALGSTVLTGAAGWLVKKLPPLQAKDDVNGQRRFMVMCLAGMGGFLYAEYRLWYDGHVPATVAPEALAKQIAELREDVAVNRKKIDSAAAYLDAYSDTWQSIPLDVRRWKRIPALPNKRYRLDLKPEATQAGTSFEVVVVDDEGRVLAGRRVPKLAAVSFYVETRPASRSLTIGVRWEASLEGIPAGSRAPELTVNATVLRSDSVTDLRLDPDKKLEEVSLSPRVETRASSFDGAGLFDSGTCGGGRQPDRVFRIKIAEAGWAKVVLGSSLPAAVYLLNERDDPEPPKKDRLARELACDSNEQDQKPLSALRWRSQLEVALNAGSYLVIADSQEGASDAAIEFSITPFNAPTAQILAETLPTEVTLDLLGSVAEQSCGGVQEFFRDIKLSGNGPFTATLPKALASNQYRAFASTGTVPFSTDGSVAASWYRDTQLGAKRCGNAFVSEPSDSVLRAHMKAGEPPPRIKVRLQRLATEAERNESMNAACAGAAPLKPGAADSIRLIKDDGFSLQLSPTGTGQLALTPDALGVGTVDAVRKVEITKTEPFTLKMTRTPSTSGDFVAYLLKAGDCSTNKGAVLVDKSSSGFPLQLKGQLPLGEYLLVIDGAEAGANGEFEATLRYE